MQHSIFLCNLKWRVTSIKHAEWIVFPLQNCYANAPQRYEIRTLPIFLLNENCNTAVLIPMWLVFHLLYLIYTASKSTKLRQIQFFFIRYSSTKNVTKILFFSRSVTVYSKIGSMAYNQVSIHIKPDTPLCCLKAFFAWIEWV